MALLVGPRLAAQTVLTVKDAEFRSRWAGKHADREVMPQYFQPNGGLDEEQAGETILGETTKNWVDNIDKTAQAIQRRLRFGPLDFNLGVSNGYQYSNQNSLGENTGSSSSQSMFSSPTFAANYQREVGVWTLGARAASGYTYFFNQDYTAAGIGSQRNPIAVTSALDLGYTNNRLSLNLSTSASSGNGYDIVSGVNNLQTSTSTSLSGRYVFSDAFSAGGAASLTYSNTSRAQVAPGDAPQPTSNSINVGVSTFADYLVTPKTNLRLVLSVGQDLQKIYVGTNQGRRYFDSMVIATYQIAPKFSINGGAGAGYVTDQDIADSAYTGLRPIYTGSIGYTPTEKTYFKINLGMQGADIRPNFSLAAGWNAREKTRLSLSLYQNQGFSSLSPDQYNVTRGLMGTITQRLIKGIDLSLSGGYEQSLNVGLSKSKNDSLEGPSSHYLTNATMNWRLREWAAWQNTLMMTSGRGSNNQTQTTFSTGLNFNF